ncbi:ArsR/SmtB family transcription factor [Pseudonocardia xinjiangensis]|uniref:Helix-turn-helix transcriptional regulator n=1 Tax=Pseudonocardia xinjiangensis TaxID=75289 RepID=A0ABX1RG96_9PSEU|nr:DUF5937 family protein [Pseudonocardia xinjiangensis]NMH79413.1 helix-turn-helix transcriptional regulator [Pseudonocardia xinjiangensis]
MIEVDLTAEDLSRIRFAFSPVAETVTSLRALSVGARNGLHAPWLADVAGRLDAVDVELLTTLVRPAGYVPDFLLPTPAGRSATIGAGLEQMAATPPEVVTAELRHLAEHPVAQRGSGRDRRSALLHGLADRPVYALRRITGELERYWAAALEPHWSRIGALLQADLAHRLEELATGGVAQLFGTLHPAVALRGDLLTVAKYYDGRVGLRGRGLLLVPCAFAWPDVLVGTADPQPSLTYSPRGLGRLWESAPAAGVTPLAGVLGRTRATILALLDLPMSTTQLSAQLDLAAPTLSGHLTALRSAGILVSRRDGRAVLYRRTTLGDHLLAAAG